MNDAVFKAGEEAISRLTMREGTKLANRCLSCPRLPANIRSFDARACATKGTSRPDIADVAAADCACHHCGRAQSKTVMTRPSSSPTGTYIHVISQRAARRTRNQKDTTAT